MKKVERVLFWVEMFALVYAGFWVKGIREESYAKDSVIAKYIVENRQLKTENDRFKERIDNFLAPVDKVPLNTELLSHQWKEVGTVTGAVAEANYTKDYACFDFSRDLKDMLQKVGVPSKIDIIKPKTGKDYHAIVSIQIEPQTGSFVYYEADQLIDQCFKSSTNGKYYCGHGVIETERDGKEVYSNLEK